MSELLSKKRGYIGHIGDVEVRRPQRDAHVAIILGLLAVVAFLLLACTVLSHRLEQAQIEGEAYRKAWDKVFEVAQTDLNRPWPRAK